jgi:hypothetical protein
VSQIESWREEFRANGVLVLPGFVTPESIGTIVEEAEKLSSRAFFSTVTGNAYLTPVDEAQPKDHPQAMTDTTTLGAVAYDLFPETSQIRKIYKSSEVRGFVESIIGRGPLFEYDCPMGALNLAVMRDGDYLRWHFDQSDFVVSINLQDAEDGGVFEYVRQIRSAEDPQYDRVKRLLDGDRSEVKTLSAPPGSLILFEGRYTIHRVSPIRGQTLRLGALLGYALEPGIRSSDYLKQIRYGRI